MPYGIVLSAAQALDNDEYYAMLDSGTNAMHPRMEGEVAECQVPSATVTGPIVQVYDFEGSVCENVVYPAGAEKSYVLSVKNGLPYLSKELFWMAMQDIAEKATLISGHTWDELKEMIDNQIYEPQPQIYSVKTVAVPEPSNVVFTTVSPTHHFSPKEVRKNIIDWYEHFHPTPNLNRGRLSGTAASLTFGAQTGRGSDRSCVIKRTLDHDTIL